MELTPDLEKLDKNQVKMIRDHLGYVFTHIEETRKLADVLEKAKQQPFDFQTLFRDGQMAQPHTVQIC